MSRPSRSAIFLAVALLAGCDGLAPVPADAAKPDRAQAAVASAVTSTTACTVPDHVEPAPARRPPASEIRPNVPVAGYVLALSWSPEFCRARAADPDHRLQCRDNAFGFVVHGLWPNGAGRQHPRYCGEARPLDRATVRRHLCMMPSTELMQHEWAAHGTCGWRSGDAYLAKTAALWSALKLPDIESPANDRLTAGDLRDAFARANPTLPRDAVFISVNRRGWLQEVRLCFDRAFRAEACPNGRIGVPDRVAIKVWRRVL